MATISENLQTIKSSTDAIKQAIINKGGTISGDITTWADAISGISGGAYSEINHGTSDTTFELTPNTFHVWDEVTSLNLTLSAETSGVANEYIFQFTSGSTPTTLTLPNDIKFSEDLVIEANKIYQISILKGLGSVLGFANAPVRIDNLCIYDGSKTVTFQYPVDSDVTVSVAGKTVTILKGEQSGSISGKPEPMGQIRNITPCFDNTYNYIY